MIKFDGLEKRFGKDTVVDHIQFTVEQGELFGFIGPNGAGKSTTIKMMMGLTPPSSGTVKIGNLDILSERVAVNRIVGYVPDQPNFPKLMTGLEILTLMGEMHGLSPKEAQQKVEQLTKHPLFTFSNEYTTKYSLGIKKRLAIACALIHAPKYLLLDEPMIGLDPRATRDVEELLTQFVWDGGTVFLSSHSLDIVESICSRVAVIDQGKILAVGSTNELRDQLGMDGDLTSLFLNLTHDSNQKRAR